MNAQEGTVLDANSVSDGILIKNSSKITGTPPTPNGKISFVPGYTKQSAFLKNALTSLLQLQTIMPALIYKYNQKIV